MRQSSNSAFFFPINDLKNIHFIQLPDLKLSKIIYCFLWSDFGADTMCLTVIRILSFVSYLTSDILTEKNKSPCSIQVSKTSLNLFCLPLKLADLTSVRLHLQFCCGFWNFPCPTALVLTNLQFEPRKYFPSLSCGKHQINACLKSVFSSRSHQDGPVEVAAMNSGLQIIHPDDREVKL